MVDDTMVVYGEDPGVAVVILSGEQEAYGAEKLERQLAWFLAEEVAVVVDLSRTTFVDSAVLLALMHARKAAEEHGLGFVLQMDESTGWYVRRTFEITRLTSVFPTFMTRAAAVEAARAGGSTPSLGAEPT